MPSILIKLTRDEVHTAIQEYVRRNHPDYLTLRSSIVAGNGRVKYAEVEVEKMNNRGAIV